MKTIKQIADEINVSKQAIQKRINREPLYTCLYPCIHLKQGIKYIDEKGENLIKSAFIKNTLKPMSIDMSIDNKNNVYTDVHSNVYSDIVTLLREDITTLKEQLSIKDRQIEELTATIKLQAKSINADRKNELAGTIIDGHKMINAKENNKMWQFWKNKNKK